MNDAEFRQRYEEACARYDSGDYSAALEAIDAAAGLRPASPSLLYARALCLWALQRFEESLEACTLLIREHHDVRGVQLSARIAAAMDDKEQEASSGRPADAEPLPADLLAGGTAADSSSSTDETQSGEPPEIGDNGGRAAGQDAEEGKNAEDAEGGGGAVQSDPGGGGESENAGELGEAADRTESPRSTLEEGAEPGVEPGTEPEDEYAGGIEPAGPHQAEEADVPGDEPNDDAPDAQAAEALPRKTGMRRTALLGGLLIALSMYFVQRGEYGEVAQTVQTVCSVLDAPESPTAPEDSERLDEVEPAAEGDAAEPGLPATEEPQATLEGASSGKPEGTPPPAEAEPAEADSPPPDSASSDVAPHEAAAPERAQLRFPEGKVLGRLFMRPWEAPSSTPWVPLAAATGTVELPAGKAIRLEVEDHHWLDLAWFAGAAPGALRGIKLANNETDNAALSHLAAFSGLRELELRHTYAVTSEGLAVLRELDHLQKLVIDGLSLLSDEAFVHIAMLRHLTELDAANTPFQDSALADLGALTELESLSLPTNATDGVLRAVGALRYLRSLSMGPGVTGEGFAHIEALPKLRTISWNGAFSAEALGRMAQFPALEDLTLAGDIEPAGLGELTSAPSLRRLALLDAVLAPAHLDHLAGLTPLHELVLEPANSAPPGHSPAEALAFLRNLEVLRAAGPAFDDSLLAAAADLPILRRLEAPSANVSADGIRRLADARVLRELVLDYTPLTDAAVGPLATLTQLSLLSLAGAHMTEDGLNALEAQLPDCRIRRRETGAGQRRVLFPMGRSVGVVYELPRRGSGVERILLGRAKGAISVGADRSLMLVVNAESGADLSFLDHLRPYDIQVLVLDHRQVEPEGLAHIARLTYLESLTLSGPAAADGALDKLAPLSRLLHLSLPGGDITDEGLALIPTLFPRLEHLGLPGCTQITEAGIRHVAALGGLHTLVLSGTPIADEALAHLRTLLLLESVWLDGTKVSEAGITELKRALPNCEVIVSSKAPRHGPK